MLRFMAVVLTYRGRAVTQDEVAFIRALIAAHPTASRRRLSEILCRAWNWVQPNGTLRDMVCRGLMLALHRDGQIELPARRWRPCNPLAQRRRPEPIVLDESPIRSTLQALQPITFRQVRRTKEEATFNGLIEAHHYLGYTQPVGEQLKYLVSSSAGPPKPDAGTFGSSPTICGS
jgi:hypothetical protein